MKNVLIVGGSGYLGTHIRQRCFSDWNVFYTSTQNKVERNFFHIDFKNKDSFLSLTKCKFELVIVLSSLVKGLDSVRVDSDILDINVNLFGCFVQFLIDSGVSTNFIYFSSMTVYAPSKLLPVKEDFETKPFSSYGLSKLLAENIFEFSCFSNKTLKGVILRLPGIYGGDRRNGFIYNTIQKCKSNSEIIINTEGLGYWEVMHVDDLCHIIDEFVLKYRWLDKCEKFNISYAERIDIVDVAFAIREVMNSSSVIKIVNDHGYSEFFMSNAKIKSLIPFQSSFRKQLSEYVLSEIKCN